MLCSRGAGSAAFVAMLLSAQVRAADLPSIAFFYAHPLPVEELSHFDQVVVEPEGVSPAELRSLQEAGTTVFAYVSIGECNKTRPCSLHVEPSWILGSNAAWNSDVVDPAEDGWQHLLITQISALWDSGYRAFFFDTVDSFTSRIHAADAVQQRWNAVARFIAGVHERFPAARLILNRGFEVLPSISGAITGVAAESLYRSWNAGAKRFEPVSQSDRRWLIAKLLEVRDRYGLEAISIDYVAPGDHTLARETAAKIASQGIVPWVTTPRLDRLGTGTIEVVSRRLLCLYDGTGSTALGEAPIHRYAAMPLQYLGYALEYRDVHGGLPPVSGDGRYAGVVTWFQGDLPPDLGYARWLSATMDAGTPVVALGAPGASDPETLARLGLDVLTQPLRGPGRVERRELAGFESDVYPHMHDVAPWHAVAGTVTRHVTLRDDGGQEVDPVVTAPWGGLALNPYVMEAGADGRERWIIDPFAFFEAALGQPPFPVPDITTESGRRVLVLRLNGAGFNSHVDRPGTPGAAAVMLKEVLARHHLAVTADADALSPMGREILALPYVEASSGTCSLAAVQDADDGTPSVADVVSHGRPEDDRFLPYFPDGIELTATSSASHALSRWHLTGSPRRLAPAGLTFSYASVASESRHRVLDELLQSVEVKKLTPLWLSEYAQRATDFEGVVLLRRWDGNWELRNLGAVRTVRLGRALGAPDVAMSTGVAGTRDTPQGRYVALNGSGSATIRFGGGRTTMLDSANAVVSGWTPSADGVHLSLASHGPVELVVTSPAQHCHLTTGDHTYVGHRSGEHHTFSFTAASPVHATLLCR